MNIKTQPSVTILYSTHQTTIPLLALMNEPIGRFVKALYAEAVRQNIMVTGPVYWLYYGMDGNPETVFTLEIAIPVEKHAVASGDILCKKLPPFKCLRTEHEGEWEKMEGVYGQLIQYIQANKLQMTRVCREMYPNIDFETPENNITEVQVGVV